MVRRDWLERSAGSPREAGVAYGASAARRTCGHTRVRFPHLRPANRVEPWHSSCGRRGIHMTAASLTSDAAPALASAPRHSAAIGRAAFTLAVVAAYAVVFAPIVMVVLISFFDQEIVTFPPEGLTLRWYVNAWSQRDFARGFVTSLQIALAATLIGVPLGTAASLALVRSRLLGKSVLNTFLLAPLAVPAIVAGSALYMFYLRAEDWLDMDIKATLG